MGNEATINFPLQRLALNFNTNGDNSIIAAVAGQTIRVYSWAIAGQTATAVKITDGASGTTLFGPATITSVAEDQPPDNRPLYVLTAGNALVINLGAGNAFGGVMRYTQA